MPLVLAFLGGAMFVTGLLFIASDVRHRRHEDALIERLAPYGVAGRAAEIRDWLRRN